MLSCPNTRGFGSQIRHFGDAEQSIAKPQELQKLSERPKDCDEGLLFL